MIADRMKTIMAETSQREFAKSIKISPSTLWEYLQGRVPPADLVVRICERYGVSERWLLTGKGDPHEKPGYTLIPLYNVEASAGPGRIPLDETVREYIPFKVSWIRAELRANIANLRVLPVSGESMEPVIRSGDVVLIEETSKVSYEGIYVVRLGDALLVKRIQVLTKGRYALRSENPAFPPQEVDPREDDSFAVIGRVLWHGRNVV